MTKSRTDISMLIKSSFANLQMPKQLGDTSDDGCMVQQFFRDKPWDSLSWDIISGPQRMGVFKQHFSSMSTEGKHYYLPAYMLMALVDGPTKMDVAYSFFLSELMYEQAKIASNVDVQQEHSSSDLFKLLTPQQRVTVAAFLKHQITHLGPEPIDYINEDAKAAYDSYWYQFDPERAAPT
jgi:hypothetical protein